MMADIQMNLFARQLAVAAFFNFFFLFRSWRDDSEPKTRAVDENTIF